jgi:hypothetical protein
MASLIVSDLKNIQAIATSKNVPAMESIFLKVGNMGYIHGMKKFQLQKN